MSLAQFFMRLTSVPLQDAERAFESGVQAIVLSNHGGRELDLCVHLVPRLLSARYSC